MGGAKGTSQKKEGCRAWQTTKSLKEGGRRVLGGSSWERRPNPKWPHTQTDEAPGGALLLLRSNLESSKEVKMRQGLELKVLKEQVKRGSASRGGNSWRIDTACPRTYKSILEWTEEKDHSTKEGNICLFFMDDYRLQKQSWRFLPLNR